MATLAVAIKLTVDKGVRPPAASNAVHLPVLKCFICPGPVPCANIFKYMNTKQSCSASKKKFKGEVSSLAVVSWFLPKIYISCM